MVHHGFIYYRSYMQRERLTYLLARYRDDDISPAELEELSASFQEEAGQDLFSEVVSEEIAAYEDTLTPSQELRFNDMARRAYEIDKVSVVPGKPVRMLRFRTWAAAAAILLLAGVGYWWMENRPAMPQLAKDQSSPVISAGKTGAVLTLADGSEMVLDSLGNGVIAQQGGASLRLSGGALSYNPSIATDAEVMYNTMTTPRGRQFRVTLPDGTKAWMNAASSLRFPVAFSGNTRRVVVQGEVYFEVAADADKPFQVQVGNKASIDVLGTSFNINAYNNESTIYTTLLQGSVKVSAGASAAVLHPGQQAQVGRGEEPAITVNNAINIEKVMAWKNGLFNFEGATLEEVMKQLERWYDIEVVYEGRPPVTRFVGEMEMNMPLKDLLSMLSEMNVHFRIEAGRRLVVTP